MCVLLLNLNRVSSKSILDIIDTGSYKNFLFRLFLAKASTVKKNKRERSLNICNRVCRNKIITS